MPSVSSPDGVATTPSRPVLAPSPPKRRGGLPDTVADWLRARIVSGELAPGTRLREAEIGDALGVSRTPVRDALRILTAQGLVEITSHYGARVSVMTTDDILEIYAMRQALESLVARLCAQHAAHECGQQLSALLPQMAAAAEAGDSAGLNQLNFAFHDVLRRSANNRYLTTALTQLEQSGRRIPGAEQRLSRRLQESVREHREITAAILAGDVDAAALLARQHVAEAAARQIASLIAD